MPACRGGHSSVDVANTTARRLSFYFAALQVGAMLRIEAASSLGSSLLALASCHVVEVPDVTDVDTYDSARVLGAAVIVRLARVC
jgi:hypothetical protein